MRSEGFNSRFSVVCSAVLLVLTAAAGRPALGQERVFVTDGSNAGDTLLIMDTSLTPTIVPVEVGAKPTSVAIKPGGMFAYVTNALDGDVSVVNIALQSSIDSIIIGNGSGPNGIAITPNGNQAYVANRLANSVSVINLNTNEISNTVPTAGNPNSVAITPDGATVFVSKSSSKQVAQISVGDPPTFVRNLNVGDTPQGLAVSPNGQFLYVCNTGSDTVSVFDLTSDPPSPAATIPLSGGPIAVTFLPNGTRAYVARQRGNPTGNTGSVSAINASNHTVIEPAINVGILPSGIAATLDSSSVYVANQISQSLTIIPVPSGSTTTLMMLGVSPVGIAIASIGQPTPTDTPTPTVTPIPPTGTATVTPTVSRTPTSSITPTATATGVATATFTSTFTVTLTPTDTLTPLDTPTGTPTGTATATITETGTITPTETATETVSATPTGTDTPTPEDSATATVTVTLTPLETFTATGTPTGTATAAVECSGTRLIDVLESFHAEHGGARSGLVVSSAQLFPHERRRLESRRRRGVDHRGVCDGAQRAARGLPLLVMHVRDRGKLDRYQQNAEGAQEKATQALSRLEE
jgi:YVTN family beta-propeller protein